MTTGEKYTIDTTKAKRIVGYINCTYNGENHRLPFSVDKTHITNGTRAFYFTLCISNSIWCTVRVVVSEDTIKYEVPYSSGNISYVGVCCGKTL